jgi:ribose-phosphate pyrophosphokinase
MDTSGPQVFSGNANLALAREIASYVGVPLGEASVTSFPNGETAVKINENVRGRDVFIVQPTAPPTNQNLMELLIMIDAARRASAQRITATRARTARTSRACRSRPSSSPTCSSPPAPTAS